ncbi:hypothetical protein BTH_I1603 [Burkholderia thailandensis E264]|uniref:Uncharacterized protein n=1 Tax=Burkholderia thailandensis (strain ATCC 700388 / DSM 13276 / CCUG 48851 / CIP 106301 / E264) TaxID=271848 RepID=Q2SY58_BURTA|nr:hypothetical protein BTH_I1603 [Burkholderia thailandensis E264]
MHRECASARRCLDPASLDERIRVRRPARSSVRCGRGGAPSGRAPTPAVAWR